MRTYDELTEETAKLLRSARHELMVEADDPLTAVTRAVRLLSKIPREESAAISGMVAIRAFVLAVHAGGVKEAEHAENVRAELLRLLG